MSSLIDRVRLSSGAKQQLITLKRRTGIEHYNVLCRHALCASLAQDSELPDEVFNFSGGLEIDWETFAGEPSDVYIDLICMRHRIPSNSPELKKLLTLHVHRGLSYLVSSQDSLVPS